MLCAIFSPNFKYSRRKDFITFEGDLIIKPELPVYTVNIEYRKWGAPIVKVLNPKLVKGCPHVYVDKRQNKEKDKKKKTNSVGDTSVRDMRYLCLYRPGDFNWSNDKLITNEIIGWTIAWLYFYECWLETGEWLGPEAQHGDTQKTESKIEISN